MTSRGHSVPCIAGRLASRSRSAARRGWRRSGRWSIRQRARRSTSAACNSKSAVR